uniref:NodB-like protein n=2 Tax=Mesorhizobium TaxID=68287 RepID=Q9RAN8_MESS7|nr:NodB-like protein [Mesorhizobium sp. 7653R]
MKLLNCRCEPGVTGVVAQKIAACMTFDDLPIHFAPRLLAQHWMPATFS